MEHVKDKLRYHAKNHLLLFAFIYYILDEESIRPYSLLGTFSDIQSKIIKNKLVDEWIQLKFWTKHRHKCKVHMVYLFV